MKKIKPGFYFNANNRCLYLVYPSGSTELYVCGQWSKSRLRGLYISEAGSRGFEFEWVGL